MRETEVKRTGASVSPLFTTASFNENSFNKKRRTLLNPSKSEHRRFFVVKEQFAVTSNIYSFCEILTE